LYGHFCASAKPLLLVAHCTTSLQTPASAIFKLHSPAQSLGCGCAKGFFFAQLLTQKTKTPIGFTVRACNNKKEKNA
jgi:hypothetical protein